ncbi:ribosome-inactivating protein gelonin-like [Ricinus communis]|uniref:ribosome-inactivating protein gelonin-like n=1 Tax=Ricinus communis TaxID=3988 RepID=UPI00201B3038|nr:ribosome-inactivating protein gelonin-like [Ricinus communis]
MNVELIGQKLFVTHGHGASKDNASATYPYHEESTKARVYPSTENSDIGKLGYPIRFILARLSNPERSTTLLIVIINVYLLGFKAGDYSYYFNDTSNDIYNLHPLQAKNKDRLPFNSSYPALKNYGAFRDQTILGITQLKSGSVTAAQVAHDVLVDIQMVSEAARFKYIEDQLVEDFFYLNPKRGDLISLKNKWEDISFAIQRSKDGTFDTIQLQDKYYNKFNVSTVTDVKPKLALLLYLATSIQSWGYNGDNSNKLLSML